MLYCLTSNNTGAGTRQWREDGASFGVPLATLQRGTLEFCLTKFVARRKHEQPSSQANVCSLQLPETAAVFLQRRELSGGNHYDPRRVAKDVGFLESVLLVQFYLVYWLVRETLYKTIRTRVDVLVAESVQYAQAQHIFSFYYPGNVPKPYFFKGNMEKQEYRWT